MKKFILIAVSIATFNCAFAQRKPAQTFDTTKKTVIVTSSYKPALRPAAKINFTAPSPFVDTTRPVLSYKIPAQNLFFTYEPAALKPLALSTDSVMNWVNDNYVKAGVGNYSTLYGELGASFGNGINSLVNVYGRHISQKGSLPFQQYSKSGLGASGVYSADGNIEWRGNLGFENSSQYYYGYRPETLVFLKDSLRQRYTTISAMAGVRNKQVNSFGISYDPSLAISLFSDNRKGRETNFLLNAPLKKVFDEDLSLNVGITADITSLKTINNYTVKNNLYYLTPSLTIRRAAFTLTAGVTPSWDNSEFHALPNITAVIKLQDKPFVLQGGWIGFYQKNSYQSLAAFNPFIAQPSYLFNTRITESFAGLKGSAGSHLSYNARLGVRSLRNAALFANDTVDGKTFMVMPEPKMNALVIHGELGYTVQEKFSLLAGATISRYSNLSGNSKAWGLLPLEVTGALRWQVLPDLQFKADAFFWDGPSYFTKTSVNRLKGAYDLNAGAEFTIIPKLNLWLQVNNILNNKYERWNQYQVVGMNVMGGIVYSFSQPGR